LDIRCKGMVCWIRLGRFENYNSEEGVISHMSKAADQLLIGRCGLYCGACPVYLSSSEREDFKKKTAALWNVSIEDCSCDGCGSPKEKSPCSACEIIPCLDSKEFSSCYECDSYEKEDCEKFEKTFRMCLESLGIDLRQNLERLFATSPEQWLTKNEQTWICRTCGTRIPWGYSQCQRCGNPLH